jgi:pimeloyl-ACP methyl ester carboxylesterase
MSQQSNPTSAHLVDTNLGPVEVRDEGAGPTVVLSHGALTNHDLWAGMAAGLVADHRVVRATLPMGSHRIPAADRSRLTLPHLADALVEVLDDRGIDRAVVVGADSGGAVAQVVTARHPDRVQGLFLFSCDAFEHFPPTAFRPVAALMRLPGAPVLFEAYRLGFVRSWAGTRLVAKRGFTAELARSCFDPMAQDRRIRDDAAALFAGARPGVLTAHTEGLAAFDGPVHIAWSTGDLLFPARDAHRLAATFPGAELSWIDDARTFSFLDRPELAVDLVRAFVADRCT